MGVNLLSKVLCLSALILWTALLGNFSFALHEGGDTIELEENDQWEEEQPDTAANYKSHEGMKRFTLTPAKLTDEDHHSIHMPRDLLCDGCRIVAYIMTTKLNKIQDRYKKGHRLGESDIIDVLDEVCSQENKVFEGYGIKEVDGVRRLSGDGLETKDAPGILQGGGRWPHRLLEMCNEYVGEFGEDVIYDAFLKSRSLEKLFCHNQITGNICVPKGKGETNIFKDGKDEL